MIIVTYNVLYFAGFKDFVVVGVVPGANGPDKLGMLTVKSVMR